MRTVKVYGRGNKMANKKFQLFIVYFLVVALLGQTVALSEMLPVQEELEKNQNQVDVDEAISPQEQETDFTSSIVDTMAMVADRLEARQIIENPPAEEGNLNGTWPWQADFTGSIVAGMISAYELTGDHRYQTSAELGGDYIVSLAYESLPYLGDEAFALTRLSDISSDPCDNPWRTMVGIFYSRVTDELGTDYFISTFVGSDPSTVVFYFANYVVAAYDVDATDKQIWRQALIDYLAKVNDDSSNYPVMALGIATWALTNTGTLDDTLIDPDGSGSAYWSDKKLSDLPNLLLSHQVPDGEPYAGSFYWRFDHGDGGDGGSKSPVSGHTEDAIFATLGLIAAAQGNPTLNLDNSIKTAGQALLYGVKSGGKVFDHLWHENLVYDVLGGEMLQVLGELTIQEK